MSSFTRSLVIEYVEIHCSGCGIHFAVDKVPWKEFYDHGRTFHCPNGCPRCYKEPEVKRLERELQRERARLDQEKAHARDLENSLNAQKAATSRLRNRIAKGVCPCCHRSFTNLRRHIASKHPDFPAVGASL